MILVDMNQVTIGNIMAESRGEPIVNEDLIRHMVVNSIRSIKNRHGAQYGEIVICYDYHGSWRKKFFPPYKENRKKQRQASKVDWKALFDLLGTIRDELVASLPYKVICVPDAEADDIIATLAIDAAQREKVLIISSDGDFQQLQKYANIDQYSPIQKKFMKCDSAFTYLFEHIIRGDASDGVPNILSPDDIFLVDGKRQSSITEKKYNAWFEKWKGSNYEFSVIAENADMLTRIIRNTTLIDFRCIPPSLTSEIMAKYTSIVPATRDKLMGYFAAKGMRNLIQHISEF